jgi:hypothetical protein
MLYEFTELKYNIFIIRCAINFYINIVNTLFVYRRFFLLKKWTKVSANFFSFDSEFDSERASSIMFNLRPPVKLVDFHGEQMRIVYLVCETNLIQCYIRYSE